MYFSGHCTDSSQKECVLIIDQTTGEITLEKLSSHMRLKKTRQERPEKSVQIEKMINSGSTAPSNISTNSNPPGHNSSRPQTPVSAFKRDSPGINNINKYINSSCSRNLKHFGNPKNGGKKCAHSFEVPITFLELF